jgi:hypothetical protein
LFVIYVFGYYHSTYEQYGYDGKEDEMSENRSETATTLDIPIFKISDLGFTYPAFNDSFCMNPAGGKMLSMSKIPGLGDIIIESKDVRLLYRFPFEQASSWLISGSEAGISKRAVISGIRSAYRHRYRQSESIPKQKESSHFNDFMLSYPITSLYVESVFYNEEDKVITIDISANPNQIRIDDLPF